MSSALLLAVGCGDDDAAVDAAPPTSAAPASESTTTTSPSTTTDTAKATTSTVDEAPTEAGTAPWAAPALDPATVDPAMLEAWRAAENRDTCPLLAPARLPDDVGAGVRARTASFGGGWGYTWDVPETPGQRPDGTSAPDAGRSTFGVAGAGIAPAPDSTSRWPHTLSWSDGSSAGYGYEGASRGDPNPNPLDTTKWLAYLDVEGAGCLYNVWSNLGQEHLEALIAELRLVAV
jgi:hypothetical protein